MRGGVRGGGEDTNTEDRVNTQHTKRQKFYNNIGAKIGREYCCGKVLETFTCKDLNLIIWQSLANRFPNIVCFVVSSNVSAG